MSSARTPEFDPDAVQQVQASAVRDLTVAGPTLAAQAITAGLVDECHLFIAPVVVGAGTPCFPAGVREMLNLIDLRHFGNGMVYLSYRTRT